MEKQNRYGLNIRVTKFIIDKLKKIAEEDSRSVSAIVRIALIQYIKQYDITKKVK
jgi:predicted transcriptional regulator